VRTGEPPGELVASVVLDRRTELRERMDVRVEPAAPDHVTTGRRHARAAEAREQRAGEQERCANPVRELLVDLVGHVVRVHANVVRTGPPHVGPKLREQVEHGLDVADARNVREHDRLVGQQARCENRQRTVLVARRTKAARKRMPAFDHERFRHRSDDGRGHGGHYASRALKKKLSQDDVRRSECDRWCEARTQGVPIAEAIGTTEDTASRRRARPGDTTVIL
jgi:hypothetical protein